MEATNSRSKPWYSNNKVMIQVLFWIIMYVYYVSSDWEYTENKQVLFEKFFIKVSMQIALCYTVIYLLIPRLLNQNRKLAFGISFFFAVYVVHIIYTASRAFYLELKYPEFFRRNDFWEKLFDFKLYFVNITWFILPTIILLAWKYYQDQKEILILREEKRTTELNALKNQLNPHFLFNTLNNLYTLSLKKSDKAPAAIMKLSKILDYLLYQCKDDYVPIQGEVRLLNHYIALEEIRYGQRLDVSFDYNIGDQVKIAPLLLLTFTENAFKHGVSQELNKATIDIKLHARKDKILFSISNSKPAHQRQVVDGREALGLQNIRRQLELLYPNSAILNTENADNHFSLTLELQPNEVSLPNRR